jgi:hypothetical protein
VDAGGNTYELTITENTGGAKYVAKTGDSYTLKITYADGSVKTSAGTVTAIEGISFTLTPSNAKEGEVLTLEVAGEVLQKIEGTVTFDNETTPETIAPVSLAAVPGVPVISSVTSGNASLTVTWGAVTHAASYEVYVDAGAAIPAAPSATETGTTATVSSLTNGTIYNVWVKAVNGHASSTSDPVATVPYDVSLITARIGTWDSYVDYYVITSGTLKYDDGYPNFAGDFVGDIKYICSYAGNTDKGIIIIEYTEKPGSPYTTGPDTNYMGVYFDYTATFPQFAGSYDTTGTATDTLADAIAKFTEANEATYISYYGTYRVQPDTVFDMGPLLGNWVGDDDIKDAMFGVTLPTPTEMKISDHRLTVFQGAMSPSTRWYSGAIVDRTDPYAENGYIWIQCTPPPNQGLLQTVLDASVNDYYVIYWYKDGSTYRFSIYNDNEDVLSSNLNDLRNLARDPYFLEYNEAGYDGSDDGMACAEGADEGVYVGFTKQ